MITFVILLFIIILLYLFHVKKENFSNYKKPLIGIVIACYERQDYLKKTLESIKKSDLSNTIICIIDDCSKNRNVWKLINDFKTNSSVKIIKVKNKKNIGIRYNLLKGWDILCKYKCDYLCNIDSDTVVKYEWLDKLRKTENHSRNRLDVEGVVVSGFNCVESCNHKILKDYGDYYQKRTIGGINMFFSRKTYNNLIRQVLEKGRPNMGWDWEVCSHSRNKNYPIIVTKPSVIQHIGIKGLNSSNHKITRYDIAEDF